MPKSRAVKKTAKSKSKSKSNSSVKVVKKDAMKTTENVQKPELTPRPDALTLTDAELDLHLETINQLLAQDRYYRSVENAKKLLKSVTHYYRGGRKLSDNEILITCDYILNDTYYYYSKKHFDADTTVKQYVRWLCAYGVKFTPLFVVSVISRDNTVTDDILSTIDNTFDYTFMSNMGSNYAETVKFLIFDKNVRLNFTDKERDQYISANGSDSSVICRLLDDPTVTITPEFVNGVVKNHSIDLMKLAVMRCGGIDSDLLEAACLASKDRLEKVQFALDNQVVPTQKAFNNLVQTHEIPYRYGRKRRNNYNNDEGNGNNNSAIKLLLSYGYPVTYDDVKSALKKEIVIDNIERFGIKFDNTYLHICSEIGMYPYDNVEIKPDLKCLENECAKSGNLPQIKMLINTYKLVPNHACMRAACSHKNNIQTVKFLVSKGGKIDFQCLEKIMEQVYNRTMSFVLEEYKKANPTKVADEYAGDKKVVKSNVKKVSKKKSKVAKTVQKADSDESEDDKLSDSDESVDQIVKEIDEEDDNDNESVKENSKQKDNEPEQDSEPEEPKFVSAIPADFDLRSSVYQYIPLKLRKTLKLTVKKHKDVNYVDFRRLMLEHLNKQKLFGDEGAINLKDPFLYNGENQITVNDLNEWTYSLLSSEPVEEKKGKVTKSKSKSNSKDEESESLVDDADDESGDEISMHSQSSIQSKRGRRTRTRKKNSKAST